MKILITGINGFAGSHLLDYIVATQDAEVHGIVQAKTNTRNINAHLKRIKLHKADISKSKDVFRIIARVKPDRLFHLAAQAHTQSFNQDAAKSFIVNVIGSVNILEALRLSSPRTRALIVSSGYIYGGVRDENHLPDEDSCFHPSDPYSAGKASIDHIAQTYKTFYGTDVVIVRPFNHTGPRQSPAFVCSAIAKQFADVKKNKARKLKLGNLEPRRDFSDVRDVVRAYWLVCSEPREHFVFNISSGGIFSVREVVRMLEEISGVHPEVEVDSSKLRKTDFDLLAGRSERLRKTFGWKPEIPFQKTLEDLYHYHLNN
jgi:GDP-4-dehydro-6-deoxy-D-mannose reductase